MLKQLTIQNIILIQSATLSFDEGFLIFSGETGAGKTALLQALSLVLGAKLDPQVIRKGEDHALVEAYFELSPSSKVYSILKLADFAIEPNEDLLIRREIFQNGKSKISINKQWAPLHLLKTISPYLVEIISQHSNQSLQDIEVQRTLLDQFGKHLDLSSEVHSLFSSLHSHRAEIKKLKEDEKENELLQKKWIEELEEISAAKITSPDEEELLFQEYQQSSTSKEQLEMLSEVLNVLDESDLSILSMARTQIKHLAKFAIGNPKLSEIHQHFINLSEELKELTFSLLHYKDGLEEDPERLIFLDERLTLFNRLKKRYGPTLKEVLEKEKQLKEKLSSQLDLSNKIEQLEKETLDLEKQFQHQAQELSIKRAASKVSLESKAQELFNQLNLSQAELLIELKPSSPSQQGHETVEFFLKANLGEKQTSLKEKVSGGELSRVLLTLKLLLAELEETPTLVFDEIDANLGGETAPKIGQLLKKVSKSKQIFAITHLPQVAVYGKHHFLIKKEQNNERTHSLVEKLSEDQKIHEIERMLGGKDLSHKASELAQDLLKGSS